MQHQVSRYLLKLENWVNISLNFQNYSIYLFTVVISGF
jgi:hypothetical protein